MRSRTVSLLAAGVVTLAVTVGAGAQTAGTSPLDAGRAAMRAKTYREALARFREAVAAAPDDVEAQLARGEAANRLGEFDEALEAIRVAVRVAPTPEHQAALGSILERMGRTDEAIGAFRTSLSTAWLGRTSVAEKLLRILIDAGDRQAATALARSEGWLTYDRDYCRTPVPDIAAFTGKLLAFLAHPERADCLYDIARGATEVGYTRFSRRLLNEVIARTGEDWLRDKATSFLRARLPIHDVSSLAESLNGVGFNLARDGQDEEAIAAYRKAIAVDVKFSWPLSNLGRVYMKRRDDAQAIEWFRKAVIANPDHFRAQQNLAHVAARLGLADEAAAAYKQALALDPNDAWTHASYGSFLFKQGRQAEGIQEMQTAVRLDPSLRWPREYLDRKFGPDPRVSPTPFGSH